jgi:hypothetical protein
MLSPEALEHVRSRDRIKYARRMQRDPQGFRAIRRAIQNRYNRRRRGVPVRLRFPCFPQPGRPIQPGVHVDLVC